MASNITGRELGRLDSLPDAGILLHCWISKRGAPCDNYDPPGYRVAGLNHHLSLRGDIAMLSCFSNESGMVHRGQYNSDAHCLSVSRDMEPSLLRLG